MILPSSSSCPTRVRGWEWAKGRFEIWFLQSILASQACVWAGELLCCCRAESISAGAVTGSTRALWCVPSPSGTESPNCAPSVALGDPVCLWGVQGKRRISASVKNSFSQFNVETRKVHLVNCNIFILWLFLSCISSMYLLPVMCLCHRY